MYLVILGPYNAISQTTFRVNMYIMTALTTTPRPIIFCDPSNKDETESVNFVRIVPPRPSRKFPKSPTCLNENNYIENFTIEAITINKYFINVYSVVIRQGYSVAL